MKPPSCSGWGRRYREGERGGLREGEGLQGPSLPLGVTPPHPSSLYPVGRGLPGGRGFKPLPCRQYPPYQPPSSRAQTIPPCRRWGGIVKGSRTTRITISHACFVSSRPPIPKSKSPTLGRVPAFLLGPISVLQKQKISPPQRIHSCGK